jgi:neurotransmitter:Na+ symporter, NSS family
LETQLGVMTGSSFPLAMKKLHKKAEFIGWYSCAGGIVVTAYYSIIIGYCLDYIWEAARLSWGQNPEMYFNTNVLQLSNHVFELGGIAPKVAIGGAIMFGLTYLIMSRGLQGGLEKANNVFIPGLLVLSIAVLIRAVTLPGAIDGLVLFVTPDFSALLKPQVWVMAFTLVTFLTSVGMGIATTMGSYVAKGSDVVKNSLIVCLGVMSYALMMATASFGIIGYVAHTTGLPISECVAGGFKLAFSVYPTAANTMPWLNAAFGVAFFITAVFAGLSSSLAFFEAVPAALAEKFKINKVKASKNTVLFSAITSVIFVTGAGLYWTDIVDRYVCTWVMMATVLLEVPIIMKYMGVDKMRVAINENTKLKLGKWFNYIVPVSALSILGLLVMDSISLTGGLYGGYPLMAQLLGIGYIGIFIALGYVLYRMPQR